MPAELKYSTTLNGYIIDSKSSGLAARILPLCPACRFGQNKICNGLDIGNGKAFLAENVMDEQVREVKEHAPCLKVR